MKNVLCYGDSNTFGTNPDGGRYDEAVRWTMRLQRLLGDGWHIHEAGIDGRTTVFDDPTVDWRNGRDGVPYAYLAAYPIDIVILMLGSNDVKFNSMSTPRLTARSIAYGAEIVMKDFREIAHRFNQPAPRFLLVSPPVMEYRDSWIRFTREGCEASKCFAEAYANAAAKQQAEFLDAAPLVRPGRDGLHLTPDSHAALAQAIAEKLKSSF